MVGSSPALLADPLDFLRREYRRLGPVFEVRAFHRRFTVLAGPDANRFVATEGRNSFSSGPFWGRLAEHQGCPHLISALDGADHRLLRSLYRDDLSRKVVAELAGEIAELTLRELGAAGTERSATELCRRLVSRQVHCLLTRGAPPAEADVLRAMMQQFRWETNVLLLGKWPRVALAAPAYRRYRQIAGAFIDRLVEETEQTMPAGWFGTTHRARRSHPRLFTAGDVKTAFLLPFVAGVDTVGATLAFLLYELLGNKALKRRITEDVDGCYRRAGGSLPTIAELRAVPSLLGAVLETLRLHPASFAIYRRTTRAFSLAGQPVPAGRDVLLFTTAAHTDPRYFLEPHRFDVDRHLAPRAEYRQRHVFAPYGGGPHVCLGAGMGESLLLLSAATLLHHAELVPAMPGKRYGHRFDPSLVLSRHYRIRYLGARHTPQPGESS